MRSPLSAGAALAALALATVDGRTARVASSSVSPKTGQEQQCPAPVGAVHCVVEEDHKDGVASGVFQRFPLSFSSGDRVLYDGDLSVEAQDKRTTHDLIAGDLEAKRESPSVRLTFGGLEYDPTWVGDTRVRRTVMFRIALFSIQERTPSCPRDVLDELSALTDTWEHRTLGWLRAIHQERAELHEDRTLHLMYGAQHHTDHRVSRLCTSVTYFRTSAEVVDELRRQESELNQFISELCGTGRLYFFHNGLYADWRESMDKIGSCVNGGGAVVNVTYPGSNIIFNCAPLSAN